MVVEKVPGQTKVVVDVSQQRKQVVEETDKLKQNTMETPKWVIVGQKRIKTDDIVEYYPEIKMENISYLKGEDPDMKTFYSVVVKHIRNMHISPEYQTFDNEKEMNLAVEHLDAIFKPKKL